MNNKKEYSVTQITVIPPTDGVIVRVGSLTVIIKEQVNNDSDIQEVAKAFRLALQAMTYSDVVIDQIMVE